MKEIFNLYVGTSDHINVYYLVNVDEDVEDFISLYYTTLKEAHIMGYTIFHKFKPGDFLLCLN